MNNYIVAYDITCPRRLTRLHRHLVKIATPIEYSVFYLCIDARQLDSLLAEMVALIDPRTDDLRCYPFFSLQVCELNRCPDFKGIKTR